MRFSVGFDLDERVREAIIAKPESAWVKAIRAHGSERKHSQVCEITDAVDLSGWPKASRLIARSTKLKEGDQQSFADHDGHRLAVFLTDQPDDDIAQLDLTHRGHAPSGPALAGHYLLTSDYATGRRFNAVRSRQGRRVCRSVLGLRDASDPAQRPRVRPPRGPVGQGQRGTLQVGAAPLEGRPVRRFAGDPRAGVGGFGPLAPVSRVIVFETRVCLDRVFPTIEGVDHGSSPGVQRSGEAADRAQRAARRVHCCEAARRNKCSETSIAKWRDQFVQAGLSALEAGAERGPSAREAQLQRA